MKVFISYRRSDDQGGVGRLFDRLTSHYGQGKVFIDVDSNMPVGVDFRNYLTEHVEKADVVLAIIGPNWEHLIQEKASDPADFLRLELEAALDKEVPVVPILFGDDIHMPHESVLPDSISKLSYLNGLVLDPRKDFHHHVERLIRKLDAVPKRTSGTAASQPPPPQVSTPPPPPVTAAPQNPFRGMMGGPPQAQSQSQSQSLGGHPLTMPGLTLAAALFALYPVAVFLGHKALPKAKQSGNQVAKGLTYAGLFIGYIGTIYFVLFILDVITGM